MSRLQIIFIVILVLVLSGLYFLMNQQVRYAEERLYAVEEQPVVKPSLQQTVPVDDIHKALKAVPHVEVDDGLVDEGDNNGESAVRVD